MGMGMGVAVAVSMNTGGHGDSNPDDRGSHGDCNLLADLAGNLLSDGMADLPGHLVALLHWGGDGDADGDGCALLDRPGVADVVSDGVSDGGAVSPGDVAGHQRALRPGDGHALLGGGALGHGGAS